MKLEIEVGDYMDGGTLRHWFSVNIAPADKQGISAHNKSDQTKRLARLIDLADALRAATKAFYQNATTDAPIEAISDCNEPLT